MANQEQDKVQINRPDEAVGMEEKGNHAQGGSGSESDDDMQHVKEFKEGGYGW